MCGIFGVFSANSATPVAKKIFFGLIGLQHRGQESAGIAVSNGQIINYKKASGMVNQIFHESDLADLPGTLGIGHTRYSTANSKVGGRQPYIFASKLGPFAIAHNGEIYNYEKHKQRMLDTGVCFFTETDTELLAHYIARSSQGTWEGALKELIEQVPGAYSLVLLTNNKVYAARDPLGMRLLCLGRAADSSHYVASESCSFNAIGVKYVKEIPPGTLVRLDAGGYHEETVRVLPRATCAFEYVYFARPDSIIDGESVHSIRQKIGRELAQENQDIWAAHPNEYLVTGVPDSATAIAVGFARASGIAYTEVFSKNRYIHRTFIKPDDDQRKSAVHLKFNPILDNIRQQKIIIVDDSIVRGNTIKHLVQLLNGAGAIEVHFLIGCPEVKHPCYMGIDMKNHDEFIMNRCTRAEFEKEIKATSLRFLSLPGLLKAIDKQGLCTACWTGQYPKELEW